MNHSWLQDNNDYLIYFGDTMCSWCYGFGPELTKLLEKNPEITLKLVHGGLRPNGTEKAIEIADFLRHHWEEIQQRTGLPFSYNILKNEDFIYDTEPAARACVVIRELNPEIEFDFFKAVQSAFYAESRNTTQMQTFIELAKGFELDTDKFQTLYESENIKEATKNDFQLAGEMGVGGFPSLVYKKGEGFFLITRGFRETVQLEKMLEQIKKEN